MSKIAKIDGIAIASIAKIDGIAKASIAKIDGINIGDMWMSPTAVSSACGATWPTSNAIDGSFSTAWGHTASHEHWIIFDMGSTKEVKKIRVYISGTAAFGYLCGVSAIYINNVGDESGGSKGSGSITSSGWNEIDVTDTSGRYIKLKLQTYNFSVVCTNTVILANDFFEFEAFGS